MRIRKAVFPVAGLGTRFLPATKAMPKEMLTVVDKPIIQYAVEEALAAGIEQIIFVTGSGKGALEDHFDSDLELEQMLEERDKTDLLKTVKLLVHTSGNIVYTRQSEPLGLGHAIWCARDIVGDEPFAVLLADDLIRSEVPVLHQMIQEFDRLRASMMAIVQVPPEETGRYGIIEPGKASNGSVRVKSMVEKPEPQQAPSNLAAIGRYILTPRIFEYLGRKEKGTGGEIQLTDALAKLLEEQPVFGFKFEGKRYDCGDKAGFQLANVAFSLDRPELKEVLMPKLKKMLC